MNWNKKKKWMISLIAIILLAANQILYLAVIQFKCTDKINSGHDLNLYEKLSAYQTHTNFWLFGWVIEPNTAQLCFCKQFHIRNPFFSFDLPEDDAYLKSVKENYTKPVRLAWKSYNSKASIYLNGSTLYEETTTDRSFGDDNLEIEWKAFWYSIPADYKPGIIKINGITISETVFDYLEKKGWLIVFTHTRMDDHSTQPLGYRYLDNSK